MINTRDELKYHDLYKDKNLRSKTIRAECPEKNSLSCI
jgi:hypothetical protein